LAANFKIFLRPSVKWILFGSCFISSLLITLFIWGPFQQKKDFLRIPIIFIKEKPCISVNFEGASYLFLLDSGSFDCFSTHKKEIIENIRNKTTLDPVTWFDIKGNQYSSPSFLINKVDIETLQISNATIQEESIEFISNGSHLSPDKGAKKEVLEKISGRIGIEALKCLDYWLIDFSRSAIFAIRNLDKLKNNPHFSLDGFTEVKLEDNPKHILISVETDFGIKKFILDTGASHSVVAPPSKNHSNYETVKTNRFIIGGYDFGQTELYLFHPEENFSCDGFLGRDFLSKYPIYLDFKKNRVFIQNTDASIIH